MMAAGLSAVVLHGLCYAPGFIRGLPLVASVSAALGKPVIAAAPASAGYPLRVSPFTVF